MCQNKIIYIKCSFTDLILKINRSSGVFVWSSLDQIIFEDLNYDDQIESSFALIMNRFWPVNGH